MKFLPLFLFLFALHNSIQAQDSWELKKEKEGIKVYTRNSLNSSFKDIRVEADLQGTIGAIRALLVDFEKYPRWAYATKNSEMVMQINRNQFIYYLEVSAPWPVTNRYLYANISVVHDSLRHNLKVISESINDYQPSVEKLVRVARSKGVWNVTTLSDKMIHIEYLLEADPGGSVPAWVLNLFATKAPMATFEELKNILAQK
jgi:hypothetical protein